MRALNRTTAILLLVVSQQGLAAQDKGPAPCPAKTFAHFIERFGDDVAVQRAFTAAPLISRHIDTGAAPEPRQISRTLARAQIDFPVMPLRRARALDGLETELKDADSAAPWVVLAKPDTDYQITYFFRKDTCWRLERVENDSL